MLPSGQRDHYHLGPARQPTSGPRPPAPHRRTQRHHSSHAHRSPPTDLPPHTGISFNSDPMTTRGGLSLTWAHKGNNIAQIAAGVEQPDP